MIIKEGELFIFLNIDIFLYEFRLFEKDRIPLKNKNIPKTNKIIKIKV